MKEVRKKSQGEKNILPSEAVELLQMLIDEEDNLNQSAKNQAENGDYGKAVLDFLLYSDNINIDVTRKLVEMTKKQQLVKKHHRYSIYQGTDGRWCTYTEDTTRKDKRHKIVRKSYNEMITYLYEFYRGEEETFRTLYPQWIEYKKLQASSDLYPERIDRDWRRFYEKDPIVDVPLTELTPLLLEEWVLKTIKKHELTKTAYYNMSVILRQGLDYAVKKKLIASNPFREVQIDARRILRKPKKKDDCCQVFTDAEVKHFEYLAWEDFRNAGRKVYRLAPLAALFSFYTGVRVGELTGLRFEDVNGRFINIQRMVRREDHKVIEHAKTEAGCREIPLTVEAIRIIKAAEEFSPGGWIFSEHERPLPSRIVEEYFQKYCSAIGTPHKSTHCARKTFTSALMDGHVNINTVTKTLGHADERTTLKNYTFDRSEAEERLDRIEHALTYARGVS